MYSCMHTVLHTNIHVHVHKHTVKDSRPLPSHASNASCAIVLKQYNLGALIHVHVHGPIYTLNSIYCPIGLWNIHVAFLEQVGVKEHSLSAAVPFHQIRMRL